MVGLQRASYLPLTVEVTTLEEALGSADPAILISAGGWDDQANPLPFSADKGRITVAGLDAKGQSVTLDLDPAKGFGSLQVLFGRKRTVLVAHLHRRARAARRVVALPGCRVRPLVGPRRSGRYLRPGSDGPIIIPNPPVDFATETQPAASSGIGDNWFWWAVGGVAAVAALGAVAILVRFRRK